MKTTKLVQRPPRFGFNTLGQVIPVPVAEQFSKRNVTIIAAAGLDRGIGVAGKMPWDLPPDMQQFKRLTTGHPVIMGRKTWEAIGSKPLPDRLNVALTNNQFEFDKIGREHPEVEVVSSLTLALEALGNQQIFIIGGGQLYEQAMHYDLFDDMILTMVHAMVPNADARFPTIQFKDYLNYPFSQHEHEGIGYEFTYLRRIKKEAIEEEADDVRDQQRETVDTAAS